MLGDISPPGFGTPDYEFITEDLQLNELNKNGEGDWEVNLLFSSLQPPAYMPKQAACSRNWTRVEVLLMQ